MADFGTLDDDWETFKRNMKLGDDVESSTESLSSLSSLQSCLHISDSSDARDSTSTPKCSDIYISTTTKIAHLDREIDIKKVFWEIPVIRYVDPVEGVIKKQIKFSTTDRADYEEVMARIANERYCDNQEIEHIDNPEGRIKFKDQRKISVGISKKDILCYRSKKKRAFFNCFVMIIRILSCDVKSAAAVGDDVKESQCVSHLPEFKEMHVKIFNTGKLEIPGIQNIQTLNYVLEVVTRILRPAVSPDLSYLQGECDTVLINSNFNCGFYIDRDKLHELLKYKYRINSNYDSCSYPGIQSKFYYVYGREVQNGQQPHYTKTETKPEFCEISFMIFRTGSVLIVGKCSEEILYVIYNFLKSLLEEEYDQIVNQDHEGCDNNNNNNNNLILGSGSSLKKQPNSKIQRRIITCSETHSTAC
jgi:TATA-box binding protein (TBP) (component of TFIID and TFIIIB)